MATIPQTEIGQYYKTNTRVIQWANIKNGDVGERLELGTFGDRTIQVFGTFGAGGNVQIQGSNNGENWGTLNDPQGNPLDFSSARLEAILEASYWIRPEVTAGDGTTDLTVSLLLRRGL